LALYVFTLGFHADHAIRKLSRARNVDGIVVVTARPVVRAVQNAFLEISAFCDKARYPIPRLVDIPLDDGAAAVYSIIRSIEDAKHIVADLSGGMRIVTILTFIALMIVSRYRYVELYISGEREDAPEISIPMLALHTFLIGSLSGEKLAILELLAKYSSLSISDIAKIMNRSERTIRSHVAELKKYEFVKGGERISLTGWGYLYLDLVRGSVYG